MIDEDRVRQVLAGLTVERVFAEAVRAGLIDPDDTDDLPAYRGSLLERLTDVASADLEALMDQIEVDG